MLPYLFLLAAPSSAAVIAIRRTSILFVAIALLYWVMVGFRFQIGVDWNNYYHIYSGARGRPLLDLLMEPEPAFRALMWLAYVTGGGLILVNVVAAAVFCWGFFAMAKRCLEPFLAVVVATPLVAILVAMSGTRQAMAMGIIYYLFATWEKRNTFSRTMLVLAASLFHFSSIFIGIFVAFASKLSPPGRVAVAVLLFVLMMVIVWFFPERAVFYSDTYIADKRLSAPGALAHTLLPAIPAVVFFAVRKQWQQVIGESALFKNLAVASLLTIPAIYISSVGASRISFYLWPAAMYIWAGLPALLRGEAIRYVYRLAVVAGTFLLLILWMEYANSSWAYLPYRNWLFEPEYAPLLRRD